jgi:DNA repair protein
MLNKTESDPAVSSVDLSAAQLEKIQANRQAALERLARAKAREALEQVLQHQETPESTAAAAAADTCVCSQPCQGTTTDGGGCRSQTVDKLLWGVFGESICSNCKFGNADFDLITKSECASAFLVPLDEMKWMKYHERTNPLKSGWKPMKLFLRKHAKEVAIRRFGSLEGLEAEKKKREELRFQRGLEKTREVLEHATDNYRKELTSSTAVDTESRNLNVNSNNSTTTSTAATAASKTRPTKKNKRKIYDLSF